MGGPITYEKIRNNLLSGYAYSVNVIGDRTVGLHTGIGGIKEFLKLAERNLVPPEVAAGMVRVLLTGGWFTLLDVTAGPVIKPSDETVGCVTSKELKTTDHASASLIILDLSKESNDIQPVDSKQ